MIKIKQLKSASFDEIMQIEGDVYRNVDGRKTLRFNIDNQGFFIKQHLGIGWREIFKNFSQLKLPVLGAKNEYLAINKLKALNIDTLEVAGFAQQGMNPASRQSFLITEALDNTISLEDYCAPWSIERPPFRDKLTLIKKVAKIVKQLHKNGINHRDLYICHFLLKKNCNITKECQLFLIDLHRAQLRKKVPERWIVKDLAAVYFSAMNIGLRRRDYLRFIRNYCGISLREEFKSKGMLWNKVAHKANALNTMPVSKKKG